MNKKTVPDAPPRRSASVAGQEWLVRSAIPPGGACPSGRATEFFATPIFQPIPLKSICEPIYAFSTPRFSGVLIRVAKRQRRFLSWTGGAISDISIAKNGAGSHNRVWLILKRDL
jgi:hypothetical protein